MQGLGVGVWVLGFGEGPGRGWSTVLWRRGRVRVRVVMGGSLTNSYVSYVISLTRARFSSNAATWSRPYGLRLGPHTATAFGDLGHAMTAFGF